MADLKLVNINKVFEGKVAALKDVNLSVPDKAFVIFVGPSGCGKSTLLRIIAGIEDPTSGEVFIGGKSMNNVHPRDRDIAMVFQNYALYPHMSVYDNMAFGLRLRNIHTTSIEERVLDAAQKLHLTELLERTPGTLSGGQRQRVALGRSIVRKPKIFLFDEPLSNLDAKFRSKMRAEITDLHRNMGTTFIYVTHDQLEAMTMGSLIVVLDNGVIQQADDPQTLYDNPANLFTATFIGLPQMNLFDAVLEVSGSGADIQLAGKKHRLSAAVYKRLKIKVKEGNTEQRDVIIGIRPEDVKTAGAEEEAAIRGEVEMTENLGSEMMVYIKAEGARDSLIMRAGSRERIAAGQKIALDYDADRLHIFEKETELTLLKPTRKY